MSLVKDEQEITTLAGEVRESSVELRQEAVEGISGFDLESQEDLTVKGGDLEAGVGQVGEGIEVAVERMDESAQGGGFAGSDLAGDESGQTFLKGKGQAALDFLVASAGEEIGGGNGTAKRGLFEAIVVIEGGHQGPPGIEPGG